MLSAPMCPPSGSIDLQSGCSVCSAAAAGRLQRCSVSRLQRGIRGPLTSSDSIITTCVPCPDYLILIFFPDGFFPALLHF